MKHVGEELIRRAKSAASVEELMAHAKESSIELTEEQAVELFAKLHAVAGELSDDELNNVAGGGCGEDTPLRPDFQPGDHVMANGMKSCQDSTGMSPSDCTSAYWIVTDVAYDDARRCWRVCCVCPDCGKRADWSAVPLPIHRI